VFSDQASIASWALFTLHRKKLYEYRNANGVKISVKMRSPEHYLRPSGHLKSLLPYSPHKKARRFRRAVITFRFSVSFCRDFVTALNR
ncbi:hypothetical protein DXT71_29285, partial [Escherichia coli]